jgi:mRNA-degrading endonuclease RelE of RelBE toxin-antitoxin system
MGAGKAHEKDPLSWTVKLDSRVGKADLPALAGPIIEEALDVLTLFRENPFPDGYDIEPMRGYKQRYRLRFGNAGYRIIYEVFPGLRPCAWWPLVRAPASIAACENPRSDVCLLRADS